MTMRKHKVKRKAVIFPARRTLQWQVTLDAQARLLNIGKQGDDDDVVSRVLGIGKPAPKKGAEPAVTERTARVLTEHDVARYARAMARRKERNATRLRNYARCIRGNWNKTLTEQEYRQSVNVARHLFVDKFFVHQHAKNCQKY